MTPISHPSHSPTLSRPLRATRSIRAAAASARTAPRPASPPMEPVETARGDTPFKFPGVEVPVSTPDRLPDGEGSADRDSTAAGASAGIDLAQWGHDPNLIALRLVRAFIDQLGGLETFRMMYKYYVMDWSYRQIADRWALPISTVRCKIQRASTLMRKYEMMPEDWDLIDRRRQDAMSRGR